jgi:choline dehydrogenase-like flavoprotein
MPSEFLPTEPVDPERDHWDVIVVGTGMGGSTIGYELARRGRRVLFLEKGRFLHTGAPMHTPRAGDVIAEYRLSRGEWPLPIRGVTTFGPVTFFAPMGCGSGGSTTIFGGQLERFKPADFHPRAGFPGVSDSMLPEQWPISPDELLPYYRRAEQLFRVCGTPDPLHPDPEATLREPPPLSQRDQVLHDSLEALGLHPYRSHVGFHEVPNCRECFALCPLSCKSDAGSRCLLPALTRHGASILPDCEVQELIADRVRITGVRAIRNGQELRLNAKVVVLAAGALMTPVLLLNSRSRDWADGVANRSGLVGRTLMLHTSDFFTIDHREWHPVSAPYKSLSLNDFYFDDGKKLGTLQAVGLPLVPDAILSYLRYAESRDPRWWRKPVTNLLPLAARVSARVFGRASLFSTIVEDLPYPENRVLPDASCPNGRRFVYSYTRELRRRNRHYRRLLARRLSPRHRVRVVTGGGNNINYGHACGTCRFGNDPSTSVLDRTNRAHDLDNLYVVDASFFPSSGGTNPSLTIAANALRVGEIIHAQLA